MRHYEILLEDNDRLKTGQQVTFVRKDDVERENRGFVRDCDYAYADGVKVGEIRIDYVPRQNLPIYYPNIFAFLTQLGGKSILPYEKENARLDDLSTEELQVSCNRYAGYYLRRRRVFSGNSREELLAYLKKQGRTLMADNEGRQFQKFIRHNVDRPRVGWIEVNEGYKRLGVGRALYIDAGKWMNSKGLHLYASTLQSDSAQGSWAAMERLGMVSTDRDGRRYLNV